MTTTDDELIDLLEAFGAAFGAQDTRILRALFDDDDVCFIGSESLVLHDGSDLEAFFGAYAAQPASFSFEWDSCQVSSDDRWGWIVGFGRELRQDGDGDHEGAHSGSRWSAAGARTAGASRTCTRPRRPGGA